MLHYATRADLTCGLRYLKRRTTSEHCNKATSCCLVKVVVLKPKKIGRKSKRFCFVIKRNTNKQRMLPKMHAECMLQQRQTKILCSNWNRKDGYGLNVALAATAVTYFGFFFWWITRGIRLEIEELLKKAKQKGIKMQAITRTTQNWVATTITHKRQLKKWGKVNAI